MKPPGNRAPVPWESLEGMQNPSSQAVGDTGPTGVAAESRPMGQLPLLGKSRGALVSSVRQAVEKNQVLLMRGFTPYASKACLKISERGM